MQDVYFLVFGKRGDWGDSVFGGSTTMMSIHYYEIDLYQGENFSQ